jgi:hypothetical protein
MDKNYFIKYLDMTTHELKEKFIGMDFKELDFCELSCKTNVNHSLVIFNEDKPSDKRCLDLVDSLISIGVPLIDVAYAFNSIASKEEFTLDVSKITHEKYYSFQFYFTKNADIIDVNGFAIVSTIEKSSIRLIYDFIFNVDNHLILSSIPKITNYDIKELVDIVAITNK